MVLYTWTIVWQFDCTGIIVGVGFKATATNDSVQTGTKSSNIKYPPSKTEKENISSKKNEPVQQQQQQQQQSASIVTGTVSRRNETSPYQNNPAPAYQKQQSQVNPSPGADKAESSQSNHRLIHSVIVSSRTNEIERNKVIEVTESAQTQRSITKMQPEFRQTQSSPSLLGSVKE